MVVMEAVFVLGSGFRYKTWATMTEPLTERIALENRSPFPDLLQTESTEYREFEVTTSAVMDWGRLANKAPNNDLLFRTPKQCHSISQTTALTPGIHQFQQRNTHLFME